MSKLPIVCLLCGEINSEADREIDRLRKALEYAEIYIGFLKIPVSKLFQESDWSSREKKAQDDFESALKDLKGGE